MLSSLAGLVMAAEVARAEVKLQKTADVHFVVQAEETPSNSESSNVVTVTFDVQTLGNVKGSLEEFKTVSESVLTDARGWIRAGVKFQYVESGGKLHMYLAEPSKIGAMGGCAATLSCTVYPGVYINDDRWMGGSDSYNELGVSVAQYRAMVINHEVGHFLGHDHITTCETESGKAPIMLQQSTGLRGCTPNSWPLPSELWVKWRG